jgi:pectate lyase
VYNWGYESCYGGEAHQKGDRRKPPIDFSTINMVGNFYKPGPATRANVKTCIASPSSRGDDDYGSWYLADNHVEGAPDVTRDNWLGVFGKTYNRLDAAWDSMRIHQQTPQEAYEAVIQHAGCSLPKRDPIDARIINEVREGTATHGKAGIISNPSEAGGWPELKKAEPPLDSDSDGLPDEWELRFKLAPENASDGQGDPDKDGYTNLEEFLNGTDPTVFVDYKNPANNINVLH